jgi:hypothetical protein
LNFSGFINPPIWFELPTVGSPNFRIPGHLPITVNRKLCLSIPFLLAFRGTKYGIWDVAAHLQVRQSPASTVGPPGITSSAFANLTF